MRAWILLPGAAFVVLAAACGATGNSTGTASKPTPAAAARGGSAQANALGAGVSGKVTQLAATQLQINGQNGNVIVDFVGSTMVLQSQAGSLGDVAPGVCVTATGQPASSGGGITATTLSVQLNMNGNCATPAGFGGGARPGARPSGSPRPRPSGSPGAGGGAFAANAVRGKVTAVNGGTLTVQEVNNNNSTTIVDVTSSTRITRLANATTSQLAVGQCVTAAGQRDASGAVQAQTLAISPPAADGTCSTNGFGGFGGGGRPGATPATGG